LIDRSMDDMQSQMRLAYRGILSAWGFYGLLWLAMLTSQSWAPPDVGMSVVVGFGAGLFVAWATLLISVVAIGWAFLRDGSTRSRVAFVIMAINLLGLVAQAAYAKFYWMG
jgi:hypothetical protein